jgi:ankyrin repeat protein
MWAVSEKHPDVARVLMQAGADVRRHSAGGFTPLLFAAREGDIGSGRLLMASGAGCDGDGTRRRDASAPGGRQRSGGAGDGRFPKTGSLRLTLSQSGEAVSGILTIEVPAPSSSDIAFFTTASIPVTGTVSSAGEFAIERIGDPRRDDARK